MLQLWQLTTELWRSTSVLERNLHRADTLSPHLTKIVSLQQEACVIYAFSVEEDLYKTQNIFL